MIPCLWSFFLPVEYKHLFNRQVKNRSDIMCKLQRRIVFSLFQENNGFAPYPGFPCQFLLGKVKTCPQFPDPVIH